MKSNFIDHTDDISINSIKAKPLSPGIAIGEAYVLNHDINIPENQSIEVHHVENEINRFHKALELCETELAFLVEKLKRAGQFAASDILKAQILILQDNNFITNVKSLVKNEKINIENSIYRVIRNYISRFLQLEDETFRQRAMDIKDVGHRILEKLAGEYKVPDSLTYESILVTKELYPSFTVRFNEGDILGIVTHRGGKTSHAAIIARNMGIPAVSGVNLEQFSIKTGDKLIIDGITGRVWKNPSEKLIKEYQQEKISYNNLLTSVSEIKTESATTKEGIPVRLGANVNGINDIPVALKNKACMVGLLRTEYFYLTRNDLPNEEELYNHYKEIIESLGSKSINIRLLDIGGDKKVNFLAFPEESNPFLGYRSIRYLLNHKEILIPQLKAILRVSAKGIINILVPMISTIQEIRKIKLLINEAIELLEKEKQVYNPNIPFGIMIEIPSVALNMKKILNETDFVSIGSNDLLQYVMAADRGNSFVSELYNWFDPVFLKLIADVVAWAIELNKPISLCGEMAASPKCLPLLLGMGLTQISLNAASIPIIRKMIYNTSIEESKTILAKAIDMESAEEVENYMAYILKTHYPFSEFLDIYSKY